ncbi:MAG: LPS export ABC transporter permease LptF [Deltaproteobacteria bacterium]|jgi:lipopolysaccharide export system permease protein|nr:LPS export ABC transporter permease LptF [Deltaproteobacteria bacterium]
MRPSIINSSVLRETVPAFLVNLMVFTFILLMARVMSLTDLVVNKGVSGRLIFRVFALMLPKMLSMSIPMAALLATLTTFLRMSADSELTVLKASGVSLHQLLTPTLIFGLGATLLAGVFNVWLAPRANFLFRAEILTLAKARADLAIKEQVFVRDFPGLTIYVGQLPGDSETMSNVVINDRRSPGENTFIVARHGMLDLDLAEDLLLFRLTDGVIDRFYQDKASVDSIFFDTYELKVSPGPEFGSGQKPLVPSARQELPTGRLMEAADRSRAANDGYHAIFQLEWHRRLSFPCAALLMAVIGMPLGASFRTKGRNFGLVLGLIIFVAYYAVFSLGWALGETRSLPPAPAVWLSNLMALAAAAWLLKGLNRSAAIDPQDALRRLLGRLSRGRVSTPLRP